MAIQITCPSCGYQTRVSDESAGKRGRCPKCNTIIQVPAADEPPVVEAEAVDWQRLAEGEAASIPLEASSEPKPAAGAPDDRRPCPMCGELISKTALKCRFCNEVFDARLKKEVARQKGGGGQYDDEMTGGDWALAVVCSGIGCIFGIVWMLMGKRKGGKMLLVSFLFCIFWNIVSFAIQSAGKH